MNENKRFRLKNLFTVALVFIMALCLAFSVACSDTATDTSANTSSSDSSSSSTTTRTDAQVITNGDFEFGTDEKADTAFPVSTSVNWTRSNDSLLNSATSSTKSSGIIDTDPDKYAKIAQTQGFPKVDDETYYNPSTPEALGLIDSQDLYVYDEDTANEDKLPTSGTKILMIHNVQSTAQLGTAQKFTSTKTFDVESYGVISVWVATKDLKTKMDVDEFGAYVQLRTTIESEIDPIIVKNINTDGQWVQVNFYVNAHDYATTRFRVVLGLGFGSKDVRQEYVEGFAYFDNVTYKTITASEYEQFVTGTDVDKKLNYYTAVDGEEYSQLGGGDNFKVSLPSLGKEIKDNQNQEYTAYGFAVDCDFERSDFTLNHRFESGMNKNYVYADSSYATYAKMGVEEYSVIKNQAALSGVENPFGDSAETAYIINEQKASSYFTLYGLSLDDGDVLYITFYAKVKTEQNAQGLTVSMIDNGSATRDKTSLISAFTTNTYKNEEYNDFEKVTLFVTNKVGDGQTRYFDIVFDLGSTADVITDYNTLTKGYALITGYQFAYLSQEEYNKAQSSSFVAMASLGADLPNGTASDDEAEDGYSFNYSATDKATVTTAPATDVLGYKGVVGGHVMVGGDKLAYSQEATTAGVINTKYIANYGFLSASETTAIENLEKDGENKYLQALLIKNTEATSYGYVPTTSSTLSANSTVLVSVKLLVMGDATAYVYLVNASANDNYEVLKLQAPKYEYNADAKTLTVSDNEYLVNEQFVQTVTASDCNGEWMTVNFYVTTGNESLPYRVEVWNGSRDGVETSEGLVVVNSINASSSVSQAEVTAKYAKGDATTIDYTRIPTTVHYTENGKEATKYYTYTPTTVYTEYEDTKTIIASFATIDANDEETLEDTTDDSTEETSETEETAPIDGTNAALYVVSMIIAIILVLVLVVIAIRMLVKKTRKNSGANTEEFYSRDTREKAQRKINENKAKREAAAKAKAQADETEQADEQADDEEPVVEEQPEEQTEEQTEETLPEYDYDNMENNIPQEQSEDKPE